VRVPFFFASSTALNPTLTIIANSPRVADHLAERLGSRLPLAKTGLLTAPASRRRRSDPGSGPAGQPAAGPGVDSAGG
jgi:hypothetical protein